MTLEVTQAQADRLANLMKQGWLIVEVFGFVRLSKDGQSIRVDQFGSIYYL